VKRGSMQPIMGHFVVGGADSGHGNCRSAMENGTARTQR
jgi:hypothetical protein